MEIRHLSRLRLVAGVGGRWWWWWWGGAPAWDGRRRTGRGDGFPETLRCSAINFPAPQSQMMMRHHPGLCGWWKIELWRGGDSHCLETRWTIPVLYLFVFATFGELLSNSCVKRPPWHQRGGPGWLCYEQLCEEMHRISYMTSGNFSAPTAKKGKTANLIPISNNSSDVGT